MAKQEIGGSQVRDGSIELADIQTPGVGNAREVVRVSSSGQIGYDALEELKNAPTRIVCKFNNGSSPLTTDFKVSELIAKTFQIDGVTTLCEEEGSITFDIRRCDLNNFPPAAENTICPVSTDYSVTPLPEVSNGHVFSNGEFIVLNTLANYTFGYPNDDTQAYAALLSTMTGQPFCTQ